MKVKVEIYVYVYKFNIKGILIFIMIFSSCLIFELVIVLLIYLNIMMVRGCRVGLYWNVNL